MKIASCWVSVRKIHYYFTIAIAASLIVMGAFAGCDNSGAGRGGSGSGGYTRRAVGNNKKPIRSAESAGQHVIEEPWL